MAAPRYVIAIDQGTTSSRTILFDAKGLIIRESRKEFTQIFPQPGWVEHDAMEILSTVKETLTQVLSTVPTGSIAAIGITNQRETTVVWDATTGKPVYNAIVWQSRQTNAICHKLKADGFEDLVRNTTGLVIDSYFSGPKVRWILDTIPNGQQRAEAGELRFGTIDSWLIWHLSEEKNNHKTDYSNASRTMLFDINTLQWSDQLLKALDIPSQMLPEVCPSSGIFGHLRADIDKNHARLPISGVAGDQQAALFGQGCFETGQSKNTYGTGCFMLLNTGLKPYFSKSGLLTTIAWGIGGEVFYALEGAVFVAGSAVQWLRDGIQIIETSQETETLAESVSDCGGVYLVPAFTGLGAPYWDPEARGALLGITRGTTRAHIARATLESIAWQTADILELMKKEAGLRLKSLDVDGGAVANNLLMQIQADTLGVQVRRPKMLETTSLGAAFLAGLAVDFWPDQQSLTKIKKPDRLFKPNWSQQQRKAGQKAWKCAVKATRLFKI
jgi:glycerol kinase